MRFKKAVHSTPFRKRPAAAIVIALIVATCTQPATQTVADAGGSDAPRSDALSGDALSGDAPSSDAPAAARHRLKVQIIIVDPKAPDGRGAYDTYFAWINEGAPLAQVIPASAATTIAAFSAMSGGTIAYEVVGTQKIETFPPRTDGTRMTFDFLGSCAAGTAGQACEQQKWTVDHPAFFTENHICETALAAGADELWIVSPPFVLSWESFMVGPSKGYDVNGPAYVIPSCTKHIVATALGWKPAEPSFHCAGHRIERTLDFLTSPWTAEAIDQHWRKFSAVARYAETDLPHPPTWVYCGNTHFPHNAIKHYDYWNETAQPSSCPDWQNFPNYLGTTVTESCTAWSCEPELAVAHWLAALPRGEGMVSIPLARGSTATFPRDWWSLILYPERAISWVDASR